MRWTDEPNRTEAEPRAASRRDWSFDPVRCWAWRLHVILACPSCAARTAWSGCARAQRYLFVSNHISLLDTLLLVGLCWRSRVLSDSRARRQEHLAASWIRKFLSRRTGFLLERGKFNPNRIPRTAGFGRAGKEFQLIVFPEGTRGDGMNVAPCQPGSISSPRKRAFPSCPCSSRTCSWFPRRPDGFILFRGLRKVEIHFGEPIEPEDYLAMPREEFMEFVRQEHLRAARPDATSSTFESRPLRA